MDTIQDIEIRAVEPKDVSLLREVSVMTFTQTFASQNTERDMQLYISTNLSEQQLLSEIHLPYSEFYIACVQQKVAGYLKLNFPDGSMQSEHPGMLEIERIYILQEFQRKSVGNTLFEYSKHIARSKKLKGIWLGVWEHNLKAIQFYKKTGFVQTGSQVFKLGDDEQTDLIMELSL